MRVYKYGIGGIKNRDESMYRGVIEQATLARRLRFKLWQHSVARREAFRTMRRELCPELVEAEALLAREKELLGALTSEDIDADERRRLKKQVLTQRGRVKYASIRVKECRRIANGDPRLQELTVGINERALVLVKALRKVFVKELRLFSMYFDGILEQARSADAGVEDPKPPRRDAPIALMLNLSKAGDDGGLSVPQLHGSSRHVQVAYPDRAGKGSAKRHRTTLKWRIGTVQGEQTPIWQELPLVFSRDIPEDGEIKRAQLVIERWRGVRWKMHVCFYVNSAANHREGEGAGVAAVLLRDDGVVWRCEDGEDQRIDPAPLLASQERLDGIQSVRDHACNQMCGLLLGWLDRQDETKDWVRDEIDLIQERKSTLRMDRLLRRLRPELDARLLPTVDLWHRKEAHLYAWFRDGSLQLQNRRKDMYWKFARELRRKFRTVLVDDRRLTDPSRLSEASRTVCMSSLRQILKHSLGDSCVPAKGLTTSELFAHYRNGDSAPDKAENEKAKKKKRTTSLSAMRKRKDADQPAA